jgi:hypothetical protein
MAPSWRRMPGARGRQLSVILHAFAEHLGQPLAGTPAV